MGVSVVGQLRERWQSTDDSLTIRAVVRSSDEAARLRLDLGGAILRDGKLHPLLDLHDDLGVDICIVPDSVDEHAQLVDAFEGCDIAVLLSAAHADFSPATAKAALEDSLTLRAAAAPVTTGNTFHERAYKAYAAAYTASAASGGGVNVFVPPMAGAAAARRLGVEVAAVATASSVRHVVLRSTMGVGALQDCARLSTNGEHEVT